MSEQGFAVRLTARVDQYLAAMESARKATKEVADGGVNFDRLGSKMQDVGMTMSKSVTLPLIAVGGAAVKMSSDFDGAFGKMVGLAGVSADEVDGLKKSVLALAGETGQAPQELAEGLYFLRSSGLDASKAMDALKVSAKASAAGLGSTEVVADAVSSAMNAYAKSGLSAAEATDILTGTARAGKAEPAELAGALGRVLPIASELGVTFKDVGGAIASLSLTGNDASTSATLLTNILSKMLKPSQQGAEALAAVGMSASTIRASITDQGLLATLDDLKGRLGDSGFVKFLEDAQAVQGALTLTGGNAEHVRDVFDQVAGSAGATDEAFQAMSKTSGFQMKQAWADIQVALIQAGDVIMPIVSGIAGAVGNLAKIFSGLPGPVQTIVVGFLGLAAAAGPVLIIGGSLVKNFREIHSTASSISSALHTADGGLTKFGSAAGFAGKAMVGLGAAMATAELANTITQDSGRATDAMNDFVVSTKGLSTASNATEQLMNSWRHMSEEVDQSQGLWDRTLGDLPHAFDQSGENLAHLQAGFDKLMETSPQLAKQTVDALLLTAQAARTGDEAAQRWLDKNSLTASAIHDLRDKVDNAAEATLILSDNTDKAAGSTDKAAAATLGLSVAQAAGKGAIDELATSTELAKTQSQEFAASLKDQQDRLEDLYGREYDAVQAKYDYRDAQTAAMVAIDKLNTTLTDHKAKQEDVDAATRGATDAILAQSEKYATLDGATLGSEGAIRRQIASLKAQESTLAPDSPLRAFLDEYIADLSAIPSNISTILDLHISSGQVTTAAGDIIGLRPIAGKVQYAATGGYRSGMTVVGEQGPELVDLPSGSYVHTAQTTKSMFDSQYPMTAATWSSGRSPATGATTVIEHQGDINMNNNGRPITIADISNALAMARLS